MNQTGEMAPLPEMLALKRYPPVIEGRSQNLCFFG